MEKNLPVPYKSEEDPDAAFSNMDCGPACLAMILNFYDGGKRTTDEITKYINTTGGISADQLQKAALNYGFKSEYFVNQKFDNIKAYIDKGMPVMVLVHMEDLVSREDKNYHSGHWMDIVGYRPDNGVYANDPDFFGALRAQGDHHNYTPDEFMKAWGDCHIDGNPDFTFLVVYPQDPAVKQDFPKQVVVMADAGARGRSNPSLNDQYKVKVYGKGTILDVLDRVVGDSVAGNIYWFQVRDVPNALYVSASLVSAPPQAPVTPPVTPPVDNTAYLAELVSQRDTALESLREVKAIVDSVPGVSNVVPADKTGLGSWLAGIFKK